MLTNVCKYILDIMTFYSFEMLLQELVILNVKMLYLFLYIYLRQPSSVDNKNVVCLRDRGTGGDRRRWGRLTLRWRMDGVYNERQCAAEEDF